MREENRSLVKRDGAKRRAGAPEGAGRSGGSRGPLRCRAQWGTRRRQQTEPEGGRGEASEEKEDPRTGKEEGREEDHRSKLVFSICNQNGTATGRGEGTPPSQL